jgi:hypothetical protein
MDGFSSWWIAFVALAIHLAVYGCSAVNLEGMHRRRATGIQLWWLGLYADSVRV